MGYNRKKRRRREGKKVTGKWESRKNEEDGYKLRKKREREEGSQKNGEEERQERGENKVIKEKPTKEGYEEVTNG